MFAKNGDDPAKIAKNTGRYAVAENLGSDIMAFR